MRRFILMILMVLTVSVANLAYAGTTSDPAGTTTGNVNDITAVTPENLQRAKLKIRLVTTKWLSIWYGY